MITAEEARILSVETSIKRTVDKAIEQLDKFIRNECIKGKRIYHFYTEDPDVVYVSSLILERLKSLGYITKYYRSEWSENSKEYAQIDISW